eukprot:gene6935-2641_t
MSIERCSAAIRLSLLLAKMASSVLETEITDGKAFTKERRTLVKRFEQY